MSSRDAIKVAARFRPLNKREKKRGANELKFDLSEGSPSGAKLELAFNGKRQDFSFDFIFPDSVTQDFVYETAAKESVVNLFDGYNGTIFAYGQTGSGKTHSMYGPQNTGDNCGIVPRAVLHIFDHMFEKQGSMVEEFSVRCAFCELYNESINDLLDASKRNLAIRESPAKGIYISELTWEYAGSEEDIFDYLELGQRNRKTASTDMNETSSRSHSIFQLELTQKRLDGTTRVARLNLVDLAGSESVKKTNATGQTFAEAKKINLSLSALGNCIKALTTKKGGKAHIPYRDSKLTRILQESLGGNSRTTLLVCLSPHHDNFEETLSTLRFAQRAKQIITRAKVNERQSPEMMQKTIEALRKEIRNVTAAYDGLTAWLTQNHPDIEIPSKFTVGNSSGGSGRRSRKAHASSGVNDVAANSAGAGGTEGDGDSDGDGDGDGDEEGGAGEGKSAMEQVLELQNLSSGLQERLASLEAQLEEASEAQKTLKAQLAEANTHLAEACDARALAENRSASAVKRLQTQLEKKETSVKSLQAQVTTLRTEASAMRLEAVGANARNAALQLQMIQMQDALVVAACFEPPRDAAQDSSAVQAQRQELTKALARVAGGSGDEAAVRGAGGSGDAAQSAAAGATGDGDASAAAQENAAKVAFLEAEAAELRKRLEAAETGAGAAAEQANRESEAQLAVMDTEVIGLKAQVSKLEREVEMLTKKNALLEEANARSTRGLRAGRTVMAVSRRRQAQMRQLQKQKKGAGLYSAMRGMLRKTNSPHINRARLESESSDAPSPPSLSRVVDAAVKQKEADKWRRQTTGGSGGYTEDGDESF